MLNGDDFRNHSDRIPGLPDHTVGDFWQWAYSDILSNRNRSIFAEFIVGVALGVVNKPRREWDSWGGSSATFLKCSLAEGLFGVCPKRG